MSLGEVLDSLQDHAVGGIKYSVVDSRPISHFSKGHLPGSLHLDATLVGVRGACDTGGGAWWVRHRSAVIGEGLGGVCYRRMA